jgi:hypothetical protein
MQVFYRQVLIVAVILIPASCHTHYPEGMNAAERKKYYEAYNKAYQPKTESNIITSDTLLLNSQVVASANLLTSVAFSIQNNSLWPQKIEVSGNILAFNPLETRYVGFAAGTKVYQYDKKKASGRGKFLFEIGEKDMNRRFALFD